MTKRTQIDFFWVRFVYSLEDPDNRRGLFSAYLESRGNGKLMESIAKAVGIEGDCHGGSDQSFKRTI